MLDAIFSPDPFNWLFGSGIGTNIGAAIVWIPIGALLGVLWSKTKYWPLHTLHEKLDRLHDSHRMLHGSHSELHNKLDRLLELHGHSEDKASDSK